MPQPRVISKEGSRACSSPTTSMGSSARLTLSRPDRQSAEGLGLPGQGGHRKTWAPGTVGKQSGISRLDGGSWKCQQAVGARRQAAMAARAPACTSCSGPVST